MSDSLPDRSTAVHDCDVCRAAVGTAPPMAPETVERHLVDLRLSMETLRREGAHGWMEADLLRASNERLRASIVAALHPLESLPVSPRLLIAIGGLEAALASDEVSA